MTILYRIYMIDTLPVICAGNEGTDYKDYCEDISIEKPLSPDFSNYDDAVREIEGFNWKGEYKIVKIYKI